MYQNAPNDPKARGLGDLLTDLIFLFEQHIDQCGDDTIKNKMNYQPLKSKSKKNGTT